MYDEVKEPRYKIIIYRITLLGRRLESVRYEGDKAGALQVFADTLFSESRVHGGPDRIEQIFDNHISTEEKPKTFFVGGPDSRLRLRVYKVD